MIVTSVEARTKLGSIMRRVADGKEHAVITRRGKKMAAIIPIEGLYLLDEFLNEAQGKPKR